LFGNRYALIAITVCALLQLAYTHTSPLQALFNSTDLSCDEWLKVVLVGLVIFLVAELEKLVLCVFRKVRIAIIGKPETK